MAITMEDARNLQPGDKLMISAHPHPFTVTGLKPHPEGIQIEMTRDNDGYKTFSTHNDFDFIDPVKPIYPRGPQTKVVGLNPYLAGGVENLSEAPRKLTKEELRAEISRLAAQLEDESDPEQDDTQPGDKAEGESGESESGEAPAEDGGEEESAEGESDESAAQTGRGRRRK